MNSLDTNILVYAANEDCNEHTKANQLVNEALATPREWIVAEQVLYEYYKALRHPRILSKPLGAAEVAEHVRFLREKSGFMVCCYEMALWPRVMARLSRSEFPYQRTHDEILAHTLLHNGVKTFHTRNTKDFRHAGFERLINPIDPQDGASDR
jgi:predicted nucleic acid-binding protein